MATTEWTDARLDDAFDGLRSEISDMRAEMRAGFADVHADIRQIWVTMIAGYVTIVAMLMAALIAALL